MAKNILKNLLLSLCSIIFCLFLFEVGLRLISSGKKPEKWKDRPLFYYVPAEAKSLRVAYSNPKKPEGTYRIAVVGDSFSFAPYMQYDDAFPKRLERMLNLEGKRKVEVVNMGVPGFSSSHEVREIRNFLQEGDVDLVLLQITLNDPEFKPIQPKGITVLINPYAKFDASSWTNPILKHWKTLGFIAARIHNHLVGEEYKNYYFKLYRDERAMTLFKKSIDKIKQICATRNIPLVASIFPLFGYNLDDTYPFKPMHETIHDTLKSFQVPYLELFNAYRGATAERLTVLPGEDFHPNEIAHRIAAEEIYAWLVNEHRIPEELIIKSLYKDRVQIELKHAVRLDSLTPESRIN